MSISFACECGRRYTVEDPLAGKLVRCKECGKKVRIPELAGTVAAPEIDIYGLDDGPVPAASVEPLSERLPGAASSARTTKPGGKGSKSKWEKSLRGFKESIPRGEDLRYLIFGAVTLVATIVLAITGGFLATVLFLFVAIAAFVCSIWAGLSGLMAANGQGFTSVLALFPALAATAVFFYTLVVPNPAAKGPLAAAATAALCYAAFFYKDRRGEEYRKPIALAMMATLLVVSFAIMLNVARYNLQRGNITPEALQQGQPGSPNAGQSAPAGDLIARAMQQKAPLPEARRGFQTRLVPQASAREPLDNPPPQLFQTVAYDSPSGKLAAYLSPDPHDGQKRPAIVWITGGDCNTIGDVWSPMDPQNDQSAAAYRNAGIVMMFPSLRGGNQNPGHREGFLGEVDDVLAAADYLAGQEFVDPGRIYLGGHSTGGTLVLLVAETTDRFRAVFSFGPVNDVRGYPGEYTPFPTSDLREVVVRSPGYWLHSVRCPTFVIEGEQGNIGPLRAMEKESKNPLIHFYAVTGATHFNILAPINRIVAGKILRDEGPKTNLQFTEQELNQPFGR